MKKIIIFALALIMTGSIQAQDVITLPQPEISKLSMYGAMDAGYVSQNIYLACTALGMKTVARAMMDYDTLKQELNLPETSYLELNHPIGY